MWAKDQKCVVTPVELSALSVEQNLSVAQIFS